MISPKQWGLFVKGAKKVGRAVRGSHGVRKILDDLSGGTVIDIQKGIKTIRLDRGITGTFSPTSKRGATVRDAFRAGRRTVSAFVTPTTVRAAGLAAVGGTLGVQATNAERKFMDRRRVEDGKRPLSTGWRRAEQVLGGGIGALAGLKVSANLGKFHRVAKATAEGLKIRNMDALARTGTMALGATAGGLLGKDQDTKYREQLGGLRDRKATVIRVGQGMLGGAITGAAGYSVVRNTGGLVAGIARGTVRPDARTIGRIGVVGLGAAVGGGLFYKTPPGKVGIRERTKRGLYRTYGALGTAGLANYVTSFVKPIKVSAGTPFPPR